MKLSVETTTGGSSGIEDSGIKSYWVLMASRESGVDDVIDQFLGQPASIPMCQAYKSQT